MKIKEKKGVTHYYDYEINKALNKYECGILFDDFFRTQAEKFEYGEKAYYNMLKHELEDFDERDWGYSDETLNYYIYTVKDNIEKIRKIIYQFADQPATDTNTNTVKNEKQTYQITLDKKTENKVLENYNFWNDIDEKQGNKNIFKTITQHEFLEMVKTANFSKINKKGISQRVKYNTVFVLSGLINDDAWTNHAEFNLNTKKCETSKHTNFNEYEKLKSKFLQ